VAFQQQAGDEDRVVAVERVGPCLVDATGGDQHPRQRGRGRRAVLGLQGLGKAEEHVRFGRQARRLAVVRRRARPFSRRIGHASGPTETMEPSESGRFYGIAS
jgi:hypothetical protein